MHSLIINGIQFHSCYKSKQNSKSCYYDLNYSQIILLISIRLGLTYLLQSLPSFAYVSDTKAGWDTVFIRNTFKNTNNRLLPHFTHVFTSLSPCLPQRSELVCYLIFVPSLFFISST
jgi:hypothetical protein